MLHLQKVETKLIKTVHHIDFLSSTIDQEITLKGLACTVNVMEADAKTNRVIQDHIKKSVIGLMELIRGHYDTLETKFEKEKEVKEATIESLNNENTQAQIQDAQTNISKEMTNPSRKLEQKRT